MMKWKLVQDYQESIKIFTKKLRNVSPNEVNKLVYWIEYKNMIKASEVLAGNED